MKLNLLLSSLLVAGVSAQCNEDDHHPENGGYFYVGAAGLSTDINLDSAHGQMLPNNTWSMGIEYPYGQMEVNPNARAPCNADPGCPWLMSSHTCSILKFCPGESETAAQTVYLMSDEDSMNACNFDTATSIGTTLTPLTDGCVEYVFEEDHEISQYFFSSPEGCPSGQRLQVGIADFTLTADQCKAIGLNTPRIDTCDCRFEKSNSTLGEPCRTAFSDQCEYMTLKEGNCCEEGTCLSRLEDFDDPVGRENELARQNACDNSIPGLCYNEDGAGTDTNGQGSKNCCTSTCTACGIEANPFANWKVCTPGNETGKANCGFLSRYDLDQYVCDFSLCSMGDYWHPDGEAYQAFFESESVGSTSGALIQPICTMLGGLSLAMLAAFM